MNTIFSFVQMLAFHSLISLIYAENKIYPLFFNPSTLTEYTNGIPESKKSQASTYPVLSVCPAETEEEIFFNDNRSKDNKALFVRKFYTEDEALKNVRWCEKKIELSVAILPYDTISSFIEFGYEIYFEETESLENIENFKTSSYSNYQSVNYFIYGRSEPTSPFLSEEKPLSFIWLKKIKLEFCTLFYYAKSVTYTLYRSADKFNVKCDNNDLGKQFYQQKNLDLEYSYSEENQNKILEWVKKPEDSTCQFTENGCLKKYNLLRPHHFQLTSSSTVSCSDLTSVPIWHEVSEKLLNYSEKFLAAISQITKRELTVISGQLYMLRLPYKNKKKSWCNLCSEPSTDPIYLSRSKLIPVPSIIYKIVKYQSNDCDEKVDLCWFDMVIVIHNEPEITGNKLCSKSKCRQLGWNSLRYLSTTNRKKGRISQFIYCCELNAELKGVLNYNVDYKRKNLNLKNFPHDYNESTKKIEYKNMKEEFKKKMHELFEQ